MPGFPLFDAFTRHELAGIQRANLPHTCTVEEVSEAGAWSPVDTLVPCRLMHVSAIAHSAGDQPMRPETEWVLALPAASEHAGPRRRYLVSGDRPGGSAFVTRTLYSLGARVPHVEESAAYVECAETPPAGAT